MSSRLLGGVGVAVACAAVAFAPQDASPAQPKPYRNPTVGSALVLQIPGIRETLAFFRARLR